jgi:hypothetical protein
LEATAAELESTRVSVAKFEAQVTEHAEKKRVKQDEMRDHYTGMNEWMNEFYFVIKQQQQ